MMNTKRILDEEKVKDFVGDFNKHFEDLAKRYLEIFRDSRETEMDIDEGQTRPKKPNPVEIRESFYVKEQQKVLKIIKV